MFAHYELSASSNRLRERLQSARASGSGSSNAARPVAWAIVVAAVAVFVASNCWAQGTVPSEEAPPPLSPADAVKQFKVADGLQIKYRSNTDTRAAKRRQQTRLLSPLRGWMLFPLVSAG